MEGKVNEGKDRAPGAVQFLASGRRRHSYATAFTLSLRRKFVVISHRSEN